MELYYTVKINGLSPSELSDLLLAINAECGGRTIDKIVITHEAR